MLNKKLFTSPFLSGFSTFIFFNGGDAGSSSCLITTDAPAQGCEIGLGVNFVSSFNVKLGMGGEFVATAWRGKFISGLLIGCTGSWPPQLLLAGELATLVTDDTGVLFTVLEGSGDEFEHRGGGAGLDRLTPLLVILRGDITPNTPFISQDVVEGVVFRALEFLSLSRFFSFFSR